jgi:tape measure domain-containing protein
MSVKVGGIYAEIEVDIHKADEKLNNLKNELKSQAEEIKKVARENGTLTKQYQKVSEKLTQVTENSKKLSIELKKATDEKVKSRDKLASLIEKQKLFIKSENEIIEASKKAATEMKTRSHAITVLNTKYQDSLKVNGEGHAKTKKLAEEIKALLEVEKSRSRELNKSIKDGEKYAKNLEKQNAAIAAAKKDLTIKENNLKKLNTQTLKNIETQKKLENGERTLKKSMEDNSSAMKSKANSLSIVEKELMDVSRQTEELKNKQNALKNTSRELAGTFLLIKAVLLGKAVKELSKIFLGSNIEIEQYITSFDVLLGSYEKAKTLVDELYYSAARTPFVLTDLTESTKVLLAFGFEVNKAKEYLKDLGDLSLGNAERLKSLSNAFGQISARTTATMRELKIFVTNGVPIIDALSQTMGVTTSEMRNLITAGKVGFKDVENAVKSLTREGGLFYKGLDKQSKTAAGLFSTIIDQINLVGREIGKTAFDELKDYLESLVDMFNDFEDSGELKDFIAETGIVVKDLVIFLAELTKFLIENREAVLAGIKAYVAFFTITKAGIPIINGLVKSIGLAKSSKQDFIKLFSAASFPTFAAIVTLTALFAKLAIEIQNVNGRVDEFKKGMIDAFESQNLFSNIKNLKTEIKTLTLDLKDMDDAIDKIVPNLDRLLSEADTNNQSKSELVDLINQLNIAFPELNVHYDEEYNQLSSSTDAIREYTKAFRDNYEYRKKSKAKEYIQELIESAVLEVKILEKKRKIYEEEARFYENKLKEDLLRQSKFNGGLATLNYLGKHTLALFGADNDVKMMQEKIEKVAALNELQNDTLVDIQALTEAHNEYNDSTNELEKSQRGLTEATITHKDTLGQLFSQAEKMFGINKIIHESIDDLGHTYKELNEEIGDFVGELDFLNSAMGELAENGVISSKTAIELLSKYPQLTSSIKETTNGYTLQAGVLEDLARLSKEAALAKLNEEKTIRESLLKTLDVEIQSYNKKQQMLGKTRVSNGISSGGMCSFNFNEEYKENLENIQRRQEIQKEFEEYVEKINAFEKTIDIAYKNISSSRSKSSGGETQEQAFLRNLRFQYDAGIIEAKKYYDTLDKYYKATFAEGTKDWQKYFLEVKNGYRQIEEEALKAKKTAFGDEFGDLRNKIVDDEFYNKSTFKSQSKLYETLRNLTKKYYKDGVIDFREYADKIREIDKDIYTLKRKELEKSNKILEEENNKKYKAAIDKINKFYDDIKKAEEDAEREKNLSELRQAENLYTGAVSRQGQNRLKQIQEDIRKLELEKVRESRESARASDLENIEKVYETLKDKQNQYFETIMDGATNAANKINQMTSIINEAFDSINKIVKGIGDVNNSTTYSSTLNQVNYVSDKGSADALINMTKVLNNTFIGR